VTRAIVAELRRTGAPHVFLDLTLRGADFSFAGASARWHETCLRYGSTSRPRPARCTRRRITRWGSARRSGREDQSTPAYAAGEVLAPASTGRIGCEQFAAGRAGIRRAGRDRDARREPVEPPRIERAVEIPGATEEQGASPRLADCGIVRSPKSDEAAKMLRGYAIRRNRAPDAGPMRAAYIHAVALLIARCALAREESRGAHYREDFRPPAEFQN